MKVRVQHGGAVHEVEPAEAAARIARGAGVPEDTTPSEAAAIVAAEDARQAQAADRLVRDGLLLPHHAGGYEREPGIGPRWRR